MTSFPERLGTKPPLLRAAYWGSVDYLTALVRQEQIRNRILQGTGPDVVLCLEHPAIVTAGRHASGSDFLTSPSHTADGDPGYIRTSRGGLLTWHGPGQLVIYPILTLRTYRLAGPKSYVATLCGAVGAAVSKLGLNTRYDEHEPGVWTHGTPSRKLASVGVHIHKGVSIHGVALNLNPDLMEFRKIRPCGMEAEVITSVANELGWSPSVAEMAPAVVQQLGLGLGADIEWVTDHRKLGGL